MLQNWPGGIAALKEAMGKVPVAKGLSDARVWAEASCRMVAAAGFYPERRTLDEGYLAQWAEQLPNQLAGAGQRLVEALNAVWAGK